MTIQEFLEMIDTDDVELRLGGVDYEITDLPDEDWVIEKVVLSPKNKLYPTLEVFVE